MSYTIVPARNSVTAWPRLKNLIGNADANIAGGYASWHMSNRFEGEGKYDPVSPVSNWSNREIYSTEFKIYVPSNVPTDIDIFTYSIESYQAVVYNLWRAGFHSYKESEHCSTWNDRGAYLGLDRYSHFRKLVPATPNRFTRPRGSLPIQVIKPVFGKNLEEVLDHFDFYLVKFAILNEHKMLAHTKAVECLDAEVLTMAHPDAIVTHPFFILHRLMKYVRKGYNVNPLELFKAVVTAQAEGISNAPLGMDELHEIISHFGDYLHGQPLIPGIGEGFRPSYEWAYVEWCRYLNEKRAKLLVDGQKIK